MRITSKAPTRIDLAGGTLDLWPLFLLHEDALTINVAVNLFATAKIEPRNDSSIHVVSKDQKQEISAKDWKGLNVNGTLPLHARLIRHFAPTQGFYLETDSLAPMGSGLGGSSTLAVAICGALNEFTGKQYQRADFIGIVRDIEGQAPWNSYRRSRCVCSGIRRAQRMAFRYQQSSKDYLSPFPFRFEK